MAVDQQAEWEKQLPKAKIEGFLRRKGKRVVLGKAMFDRYYSVFDPDLWSIRFYNSEQDYFHGDDVAEVSLQGLKEVTQMRDKKDGKRFNVVDFNGVKYELLAESKASVIQWLNALEPYVKIGAEFGLEAKAEEPAVDPKAPIVEEEPEVKNEVVQDEKPPAPKPLKPRAPPTKAALTMREIAAQSRKSISTSAGLSMKQIAMASRTRNPSVSELPKNNKTNFAAALDKLANKPPPLPGSDDEDDGPKKPPRPLERRFTDLLLPMVTKSTKVDESKDGKQRRFTDLLDPIAKNKKLPDPVVTTRNFYIDIGGDMPKVAVSAKIDKESRTTHVTWEFTIAGHAYKVELFHGRVWGRRTILVDGVWAVNERQVLDSGSQHELSLQGGHKVVVLIISEPFAGFTYDIIGKGQTSAKPEEKDQENEAAPAADVESDSDIDGIEDTFNEPPASEQPAAVHDESANPPDPAPVAAEEPAPASESAADPASPDPAPVPAEEPAPASPDVAPDVPPPVEDAPPDLPPDLPPPLPE